MAELFLIERIDGAAPSYLSEKIGRDFGSPLGGWTADRASATPYSSEKAEQLLAGPLAHIAPHCKVEPQ